MASDQVVRLYVTAITRQTGAIPVCLHEHLLGGNHLLQWLPKKHSRVNFDLMAHEANVSEVPSGTSEDQIGIWRDDHDVVAIPHPAESVVEFVEVQI